MTARGFNGLGAAPVNRRRAFTLMELMVAFAVFAIALAAVCTVFFSAVRLRNAAAAAVEERLPIEQAVALVRRDLSGILLPGGSFSGALKSTEAPVVPAGIEGRPVTPAIHTSSATVDDWVPWGDVQKVAYYLVTPTNRTRGMDLVRVVVRNLLPQAQEEASAQWLMGNVEAVAMAYHTGTEWRETWDSTTESSVLPRAIRMSILRATESGARSGNLPIEIVAPIWVQADTNQTTQATGGGGGGS